MSSYTEHAADAISVPTQGQTMFLMRAQRIPAGVRLYASRDIPHDGWGQRDRTDRGVVWRLEADLGNVLVVDRPTIGECVAWVLDRWMREDSASAELERRRLEIMGGGDDMGKHGSGKPDSKESKGGGKHEGKGGRQ